MSHREEVIFAYAVHVNNNTVSKLASSPNEIKGLIAKEAWPNYTEYMTKATPWASTVTY